MGGSEKPSQDGELDSFCCGWRTEYQHTRLVGGLRQKNVPDGPRDRTETGDEPSTPPEPDPGRRALLGERVALC